MPDPLVWALGPQARDLPEGWGLSQTGAVGRWPAGNKDGD